MMSNTTIIVIISILISTLVGFGLYILFNEFVLRIFQKGRFDSTLKQRKTEDHKDHGLARSIRNLIEQYRLEEFFKVDDLKTTLAKTGSTTNLTLDTLLLTKTVTPFLVGFICYNFNIAAFIINETNPSYTFASLLISACIGAGSFPLPDYLISLDAKRRAADFMMAFPSVIDLLLICIQSGISFEHALQRVSRDASVLSKTTGEELSRIIRDIHLLGSREKALMNFKRRIPDPAVDDFVLVVLQSERYGTSMSDAFRVLSSTVRTQQMMIIERKVLKLPVIISVLVMVFMMPPVLLMIFAPLVLGGLGE